MMSTTFRTLAAGYQFEPSLLEHLNSLRNAVDLLSQLEEAPYGLDMDNLILIQHDEEAIIVVPIQEGGAHVADFPLIRLPKDWTDSCCFPLMATYAVGVC
jgi:hypothetical protein